MTYNRIDLYIYIINNIILFYTRYVAIGTQNIDRYLNFKPIQKFKYRQFVIQSSFVCEIC